MIDANQHKLEHTLAELKGEIRTPPAASIGLADTIAFMEEHGMSNDQVFLAILIINPQQHL